MSSPYHAGSRRLQDRYIHRMALVDRSLLRLFGDKLPPIGPYFYDQTRTGAFTTEATNTFRDEPTTLPVSEAVVEEAERLAAQVRNEAGRDALREEAKEATNYAFQAKERLDVNAGIDFRRRRLFQQPSGGGQPGQQVQMNAPAAANAMVAQVAPPVQSARPTPVRAPVAEIAQTQAP